MRKCEDQTHNPVWLLHFYTYTNKTEVRFILILGFVLLNSVFLDGAFRMMTNAMLGNNFGWRVN